MIDFSGIEIRKGDLVVSLRYDHDPYCIGTVIDTYSETNKVFVDFDNTSKEIKADQLEVLSSLRIEEINDHLASLVKEEEEEVEEDVNPAFSISLPNLPKYFPTSIQVTRKEEEDVNPVCSTSMPNIPKYSHIWTRQKFYREMLSDPDFSLELNLMFSKIIRELRYGERTPKTPIHGMLYDMSSDSE